MSANHAAFNLIFRFVENYVSPVAGRISSQRHVMAIRDGFISAMPFMIVGSFLLVFAYPPFSPDTTWGFARGLAPIFPYTFYHLTHYWFAAADIPVANDTPVHYADAIRCNVRRPPQGSLPLLTRRVSA